VFGILDNAVIKNIKMRKYNVWIGLVIVTITLLTACVKSKLGELPSLSFTYSNNIATTPSTVSFEAQVFNTKTVSWDFGDGQSGAGESTNHFYSAFGVYSVTATAKSPEGFTRKETQKISVCPYSQIVISQIVVTVPTPTYFYGRLYTADGTLLVQTHYVFAALVANDTLAPLVTVTNLEKNLKFDLLDYGIIISSFSFQPSDYYTGSTPFPSVLTKTDAAGRTVALHVSWN
jgi:PKD repeat protein